MLLERGNGPWVLAIERPRWPQAALQRCFFLRADVESIDCPHHGAIGDAEFRLGLNRGYGTCGWWVSDRPIGRHNRLSFEHGNPFALLLGLLPRSRSIALLLLHLHLENCDLLCQSLDLDAEPEIPRRNTSRGQSRFDRLTGAPQEDDEDPPNNSRRPQLVVASTSHPTIQL